VFISYSHRDLDFVRKLDQALKQEGFSVWFDERIRVSEVWTTSIMDAIKNCSAFVVIMTPDAQQSDWVEREILLAQQHQKPIFPVLLKGNAFPLLVNVQYVQVQENLMPPSSFYDHLSSSVFRSRILVDEAHRQAEWLYVMPTVDTGYKSVFNTLASAKVDVNYNNTLSVDVLNNYDILVLPIPYGTIVEDSEYEAIASWVASGGSLLVMGFYLMEVHLHTNLNQLVRRFGFEFKHNLLMPSNKYDFGSCVQQAFGLDRHLCIMTTLSGLPKSHKIFDGIGTIALLSSCSVDGIGGDELILSTSTHCSIMRAVGHKNADGKIVQIRDYVLDQKSPAPFLIAKKHGNGKVVGIGSWKVFINDFTTDNNLHNGQLFKNVIEWLGDDT
jgi:hypothetical protein